MAGEGSAFPSASELGRRSKAFWASEDCRSLGLLIVIVGLLGFNGEVIRLVMLDVTGVSDTMKAWVGSSMQVGALVGATLGGRIGDYCGRRTTVLLSAVGFMLIAVIAIVMHVRGDMYWSLLGLHTARGIFFGLGVANAQPWATERLTDERRGWVSSIGHIGWTIGHSLALGCGKLGVTRTRDLEVLPLVPAIIVFSIVYGCSESAEWKNQSRDILPYSDLIRGHGNKIALLICFWLVIPASSYIVYFWGPEMLREISGDEEMDYDFFMIVHWSSLFSSLVAGLVIDYGRRLSLVVDLLLLTLGFILIQLAPTTALWKLSFLFVDVCITFGWTVGPVLSSESFPTVFRARAYGTLQLFVRCGSISGPVVTGSLRDTGRTHLLFNGLAALAFAAACSVFFMPEPQFAKTESAKTEEASLTSA
jgi:MFS family permease